MRLHVRWTSCGEVLVETRERVRIAARENGNVADSAIDVARPNDDVAFHGDSSRGIGDLVILVLVEEILLPDPGSVSGFDIRSMHDILIVLMVEIHALARIGAVKIDRFPVPSAKEVIDAAPASSASPVAARLARFTSVPARAAIRGIASKVSAGITTSILPARAWGLRAGADHAAPRR